MPSATILYDSDCGFCKWSLSKLLAWDRDRRLRPVALQDPEADVLLRGMPGEQKMASSHLVTADGAIHSGGDAFPPLFKLLPGGAPLSVLSSLSPPASRWAYHLIARDRGGKVGGWLSGAGQSCTIESRDAFEVEGHRLKDRVVAVTGAARGIGRATAQALAAGGAKVALGDLDGDLARAVADEIGHGAIGLEVNVTDRTSFERFLDETEAQLGPLYGLVNNAGILHLGPFEEEDDAAAHRQIDVNLHGARIGTGLGLARLKPHGRGHIVNIASSAGKFTPAGAATYAATKHAVVGLTGAVRAEHRDSGIEFSVIMPGVVRTDMIAGYQEVRGSDTIEPRDVANAIVGAFEKPRFDVFVPGNLNFLYKLMSVMPRRFNDRVIKAMKVDSVLYDADRDARAEYESRAAASDPDPESEPALRP